MSNQSALLIVDVQFDFLPGGALAVKNGDTIIPVIVELSSGFETIVATQDWHPIGHKSFASSHLNKNPLEEIHRNGNIETLWPEHCIQDSKGAEIHLEILKIPISKIIQKGTNPEIDSYSAFFDNHRQFITELDDWLKNRKISQLYICGLATDYCVKFTVLDALSLGYEVFLLGNAIKGVNVLDGDSTKAIEEMKQAGAKILES